MRRAHAEPGLWTLARGRWLGRAALCFVCGALAVSPALGRDNDPGAPKIHTVYPGQRLGSIAKRYHVTLAALRNANGLGRADRIRAGQRLLIPNRDDPDGSQARDFSLPDADGGSGRHRDKHRDDDDDSGEDEPAEAPRRTHRVYPGQRLGSIAKRYHVSLDALCAANGLKRHDRLIPGKVLTIPDRDDPHPEALDPKQRGKSWRDRATRGEIVLFTYDAHFRGRAVDRKGKVPSATTREISKLLGATGSRPRIDPRLIRMLGKVSDKFAGRPIRVVSGFRTRSFYEDSRHRQSRAVDFSIPGVQNSVLRDYLRTLRKVGVGYYPNSSFVHLDVRDANTYWVDYAGPGEAPRGSPRDSEADADLRDPEVLAGSRSEEPEAASSADKDPPDSDDAEHAPNTGASEAPPASEAAPNPSAGAPDRNR